MGRLGFFAILLAAVFANNGAGASTVPWDLTRQGEEHPVGAGFCLPLGSILDAFKGGLRDSPPRLFSPAPLAGWPEGIAPLGAEIGGLTGHDPLGPIPNRGTVAGPDIQEPGPSSGPRNTDYSSTRPGLDDADLAAWKTTDGTPSSRPEDWLFRMQFAKASSYQVPARTPIFPVPEPATSVILLMGIAGILARGKGSAALDGRG